MIGYKAAGEAIFGKKSATTVEEMNIEAVADILENWMEVPINVHAIIEYARHEQGQDARVAIQHSAAPDRLFDRVFLNDAT